MKVLNHFALISKGVIFICSQSNTVIFSRVKIQMYDVFVQKVTWYFIGVYIMITNNYN